MKYIAKLSMNVHAFICLPLNSGGSPKSPVGVCIAGAAGGSGPGSAAISEKCVDGVKDELEELDELGSPGSSGFAVSSLGMYSRSVSLGLGSVVVLRPNLFSGLSSGTVADSDSAGRSLESLNGSSGL